MSFDQLGLTPELLRAVADQGYTEPTPVQSAAIPLVLAGRDVLAGAQTGTGKTAAFVLPILQRLNATRPVATVPGRAPVRVLVLVPTRELALQVEESVRTYGAQRPVHSAAVYGGVGYEPQLRAFRHGVEVVVATPGRLIDHLEQGNVNLSRIETLVLDEADRMLDMGFIRDIRRIVALLPKDRQTLLFSATFSDEIRSLAAGMLREPAQVQVTPRNTATELVRQVVIRVDRDRKRELLSHLVHAGRIDQALVFARTKHGANRLAQQLEADGIRAAAIHGNRSQSQRVRALADFKEGRVALLVATEVAARGLDIEALPHVVNFELPMVPEDYVHRIGRTGRAGVEGDAISLVCIDEARMLLDIERLLGHRVASETVPGFEPNPMIRPEAIRLRSNGMERAAERGAMAPRRPSTQGQPTRPGFASGPAPRQPAFRQPAPRPQVGTSIGAQPARRPVGEAPGARNGAGHPGSSRPSFGGPRPVAPAPRIGGQGPRPFHTGPSAQRPAGFVALPGERFSHRPDGPDDGPR